MAMSVLQTATGATTAITATSVVATWSNNANNGNLIVVGVNGGTSTVSSITDTAGNTYTSAELGNNSWSDCEIWYATDIKGGGGTITANFVGQMPATIHIYEVAGADISYPLDKHANAAGDGVTSNTPTVTTAATTNTNELVFAVSNVYLGAGTDTYTAGAGYSNFTTTNSTPTLGVTTTSGAETNVISLKGTQTATFSLGFASTTWEISIATFAAYTQGTTTSTSSTSTSSTSTSTSSTSTSTSSTSSSTSSTSLSTSSTSKSTSTSSTSISTSSTSSSTSSTSSSTSSTSTSSTSSSTSISSTSSSISSTSTSSTSTSSTSSSVSTSSTSSSISSTSSSISSTSASTSSTSVSTSSTSSSTSTTTIPINLDYSYQDSLSLPSNSSYSQTFNTSGTWTVPNSVTSVTVEAWGGGGGSGGATSSSRAGAGGGGGGYAKSTINVTPGTVHVITVGMGGGGANLLDGTAGGNSSFDITKLVAVGGGLGVKGSTSGAAGGTGGSGNVGTTTNNGGTAASVSSSASTHSSGGGGSGGDTTAGGTGTTPDGSNAGSAGAAGTTNGATGGAGNITGANGISGNAPGGGAGGGDIMTGGNSGGVGGNGRVNLTWTAADLANPFTSLQVGNVGGDDGDYWIQTGSEYLIAQYKKDWTNNTDTPSMVWRGRTTLSTLVSPVYLQIYNVNSAAWETLDTETLQPADIDFQMNGSQASNVSNYYDSSNIVSFRIYQQVI